MRFMTRAASVILASLLLATGAPGANAAPTAELPPVSSEELSSSDSMLALINPSIQLSTADYHPTDLRTVAGTSHQLREEAADAVEELLVAARQAGHSLQLISAFRSYERQRVLFNQYESQYGTAYAERISARPGTSEHQLGLAADVGYAGGNCQLRICFGDTAAGKWLAQHSAEYGLIIRYPAGQEEVTGYSYEPWHLRYIGIDHAQAMQDADVATYEQYYNLLLDQAEEAPAEPTENAVETTPAAESSPWGSSPEPEASADSSDDLVVLRFLPPFRDWSFGLSR